jgi:hypothetical protein
VGGMQRLPRPSAEGLAMTMESIIHPLVQFYQTLK